MIGIRINPNIGIGDAIQFTSLPENYFRSTGEKLFDLNSHWVLDYNPYVIRGVYDGAFDKVMDLWDLHCNDVKVAVYDRTVMMCNAEAQLRHFDQRINMYLNRPRLYRFEEYPYFERKQVLLHVKGKSHGQMPEKVVEHVLQKYGHSVALVGHEDDWRYSMPRPHHVPTSNPWALAEVISRCRMFIGVDSGPSWIAQCYPDVLVKKVRLFPSPQDLKSWVPLEWCRIGSHWDDRSAFIYNPSEEDCGFTWSYLRI